LYLNIPVSVALSMAFTQVMNLTMALCLLLLLLVQASPLGLPLLGLRIRQASQHTLQAFLTSFPRTALLSLKQTSLHIRQASLIRQASMCTQQAFLILHIRQASLHNSQASLRNPPTSLYNSQASLHNPPTSLYNSQASLHNSQASLHNSQASPTPCPPKPPQPLLSQSQTALLPQLKACHSPRALVSLLDQQAS